MFEMFNTAFLTTLSTFAIHTLDMYNPALLPILHNCAIHIRNSNICFPILSF